MRPETSFAVLLILLLPLRPTVADAGTGTTYMPEPRLQEAITLMNAFAGRTGLDAGEPPRRYLWTDAFAVCNYLGLGRATGEERYTGLALQLVEQVHHTLGRHRDDDPRRGWISGLDEDDGERHPTRGGLRIGKSLPERAPDAPLDERLEWDRDGQYFHYLTRWMHALDQVTRTTQQTRYNTWARELAGAAFQAFTGPDRGTRRMVWKMSIDLTRVLVPSMGQHDPLDGYITALQLQTTAAGPGAGPDLDKAIGGYAAMIRRGDWTTPDPLGLGGLLVDAWRVQQLIEQGAEPGVPLLERLLDGALTGLHHYARSGELQQQAGYRLAFRELGLAIGLHALERLQQAVEEGEQPTRADPRLRARLQELVQFLPLREAIEDFWRAPANRQSDTWREHRDINEVMLATSLAPDGYLKLLPPE
jgi:hypothetical protein